MIDPRGLLRWRDVTNTLQRLVARGLFGNGQRLYQLPGGSWAIVGVPRILVQFGAPEIDGEKLTRIQVNAFFGGDDVLINGVPVSNVPAPFLTLTQQQLDGPSMVYMRATFDKDAAPQAWITPVSISVDLLPVANGGPFEIVVPLAIIKGGRVVTVNQYTIGS
jgi:hypothetical protein